MLPAEDRLVKAVCLDKKCRAVFYISTMEKVLECYHCGQKYSRDALQETQEVPAGDFKEAFQNVLCRVLLSRTAPKRGTEMVKVHGLSNYYCKLLSPLLTRYGMDKSTGRAKLLTEMNQGEIFDCSLFGDRAFLIEPEHIPVAGYGKDITGSLDYLSETLKLIVESNGDEERLIPVHADGDGHCLVHAISRALVGRELFWHPLRCCLKKHFENDIDNYKELFKDFIDTDEWEHIIAECDPNFQPPEGEMHGLRNIHIFGFANILRRPIILLDSLDCMQKCGDYSALFLPGFVSPEACRGKDNTLNKPLCIAWSSHSHNHYIPLVGVQKMPLPVIPSALIPKVWGMPQSRIASYIEFDDNGSCVIGGSRSLSIGYIQRLVHAMEVLFYETNGIHPTLVADAKLYLYPDNILFSAKPAAVLERARTAVQEGRLYRCLFCKALCELQVEEKWFANTSAVRNQLLQSCKRVQHEPCNIMYQGICYKYDPSKNEIVVDISRSEMQNCNFCACHNCLRKVTNDGTVIFKAEDKDNPDKAYWYSDQARKFFPDENLSQQSIKDVKPIRITVKLKWNEKEAEEEISCIDFQNSSKESLNEFVKELSKKLIKKHFSDESSDSKLQEYISEEIWKQIQKAGLKRDSEYPTKSESKQYEVCKAEKAEDSCSSEMQQKVPELQYVKVVTSDGQQANLTLTEEGVSYGQLQEWIRNEFKIPVRNQRIKLGFPPKEIQPSGDTNKQMLSLKHGDRLMVEIHQKDESTSSLLTSFSSQRNAMASSSTALRWTKFQSEMVWNMVKLNPGNFRRNGCIYEQVAENNRLNSTLHTDLPGFDNKVFCYNNQTDTIDLCVKSLGHFLISSDIEERIEQVKKGATVLGYSKCPLMSRLEAMSGPRTFLRTVSSQNSEENQRRPLLRKGPGFSVLTSPPDNMDIS